MNKMGTAKMQIFPSFFIFNIIDGQIVLYYCIYKTCGNIYPMEKIATEKGGCNPGPINPNLKVENGIITIEQSELEEIAGLF
ncbi:MAG: Fe-S-containing protein [Patescibacteria group bacterium]|nr:Fe-S-containing protein [Patescibacteria group bacterium]